MIAKFKFVIPIKLYYNNEYNKLRRMELILISNIIDSNINIFNVKNENILKLSSFLLTNTILNIENSCYNHTLEKAKKMLILPNWTNALFEELYRTTILRITKNLECYML